MNDLDPSIVVAAIAAAAAVVGACATLLGLYVTRGTETRRLLAAAPQGYAQLVDDLQQERTELRTEVRTMGDEIASMRTRLRGLETGQDTDRRLIEALRLYVLELRTVMRRADITPPPIPVGLGIEDSGEFPAVTAIERT